MPIVLAVSRAKFVASPRVLPLNTRVTGFSSLPPLARFARVVQKSAAASAPTAVKRTRFSRSQKGCGANSFGRATTGAYATTTMEPGLAGRARPLEKVVASQGALGRGSIEARLTAACSGSREAGGDKGARENSCANSDPEHVSKSARSSRRDRKAGVIGMLV